MRRIKNIIKCEIINDMGMLVERKIQMVTDWKPRVGDKLRFTLKHHFKPIIIKVVSIADQAKSAKSDELTLVGEEIDLLDNVRFSFKNDEFSIQ